MAGMVVVEIEGLDALLRKASDTGTLIGKPLRQFFTRGASAVQKESRLLAPVDEGRLRGSINYEVDGGAIPEWAKIGPNVTYGATVEYGLGEFNEGPGGMGQAPLPTAIQLEGWARRHGMNAYAVAEIIRKRGGIRPNPYMRTGFRESLAAIGEYLLQCGRDIAAVWNG